MNIAFVVNTVSEELAGYTTTLLAMEATRRKHTVWYIEVASFSLQGDSMLQAHAWRAPSKHYRSADRFLAALKHEEPGRRVQLNIADLDVMCLRNDPNRENTTRPWARMSAIHFAQLAVQQGVIVLNDPYGLSKAMNKLYLQKFPASVRPDALVSRHKEEIIDFIDQHSGHAVLKPLNGSGGRNVFLAQPDDRANWNQMIEAVSGDGYVLAQEYIEEATRGDMRLFLANGRPLQCNGKYAAIFRTRGKNDQDMRSNMTAGAHAEHAHISAETLQMVDTLRPKLVSDGMFLVGLDIVGTQLLEINVFSPGGLVGAQRLEQEAFATELLKLMESKAMYASQYKRHFNNRELAVL